MTEQQKSVHDILLEKFCKKINDNDEKLNIDFKLKEILKINPKSKQICLECVFAGQSAVLILEKNPFEKMIAETIAQNFSRVIHDGRNLFRNDIYGAYLMDLIIGQPELDGILNKIFVTIIHPAQPKDVEKYRDHPAFMVRETAQLYQTITKPYIERQINRPGHLQWLYNIIDGTAEQDRVIHNDPGQFLLCKDMKWKCDHDGQLTESEKTDLYLNAFVIRRDLHSLRDLTAEHLPLLERIYDQGKFVISKKYSISPEELRIFIHYQPSFYHLHVHFTHVKNESYGFQCERAHLLSGIIENLRMIPDYYQRVTLEFCLSSISELKY